MKIYHDFYGCVATIRTAKSGGVCLTVRGRNGRLIHTKNYRTERGAKIAMARLSDGWHQTGVARKGGGVCPARA